MSATGNGSDPRRGELTPQEREAFRKRAESIGKHVDDKKGLTVPVVSPEGQAERGSAMGQAMKVAVDLVAGVAVGGGTGWVLDNQLGTRPWLLIVFLMLGTAAGMLNTIRSARKLQAAAEPMQRSAPSVRDDEDEK